MSVDLEGYVPLLQVFDMPTSVAFYRDVLGFQVKEGTPDWVWLVRDGMELMLNTAYESDERPPRPDPVRMAAHDDTALFFGCQNVDAAYETLKAMGIQSEPPRTQSYGMRQLYFHDPDGYNICLQWPSDESK